MVAAVKEHRIDLVGARAGSKHSGRATRAKARRAPDRRCGSLGNRRKRGPRRGLRNRPFAYVESVRMLGDTAERTLGAAPEPRAIGTSP
jgi:hypothetical protein